MPRSEATVSLSEASARVLADPVPGYPQIDSITAMMSATCMLLRRARTNQQFSLTELATLAGMTPPVLSRLETSKRAPHLERVLTLCNLLALRPSDLFQAVENEAFPMGGVPWTDQPARLLAAPNLTWLAQDGRRKGGAART
ncbi:MAG TPA: helix-turn-helix transcriptional regulator [Pseudonocardiaceae bacterium]|nr:helix-turn-helix transcriptional regulator [Pseudonocardiaceae bacterium]